MMTALSAGWLVVIVNEVAYGCAKGECETRSHRRRVRWQEAKAGSDELRGGRD
jgi:hypothetical protein